MATYYITPDEAMMSVGRSNFIKLFDENNTRKVDDAAVLDCIEQASAMTTASLAHNYPGDVPFSAPVPAMAKQLTRAYFKAFAWPRNPDLMKGAGYTAKGLEESADRLAEALRKVVLHIIDALPNPTPTNTGGAVGTIGVSGGCRPQSMFSKMGDY